MHEGRLDQRTAVSSLDVCVRCWYKCGVNLASDLLLPFFAELYTQNFCSQHQGFGRHKEVDVLLVFSAVTLLAEFGVCNVLKHLGVWTCCPFRGKLAGAQGSFGAIHLLAVPQTIA